MFTPDARLSDSQMICALMVMSSMVKLGIELEPHVVRSRNQWPSTGSVAMWLIYMVLVESPQHHHIPEASLALAFLFSTEAPVLARVAAMMRCRPLWRMTHFPAIRHL